MSDTGSGALPPFGLELRRLRQRSGMSLRMLGHEAQIDHGHLGKLERGERDPTVAVATAVDRVFGTTPHLALLAAAAGSKVRGVPSSAGRLRPGARVFVGREPEWARLDEAADLPAGPAGVRVVVLHGGPGVGTTELALQWGQAAAERFPAGQVLLDLHGFDDHPPADPGELLEDILHRHHVPRELMPPSLAQRSDLHRALLGESDLRLLYVLDDAHSDSQVLPLLPPAPGCMVVVTSRLQLTGLLLTTDAVGIALGPLSPPESVELFGRVAGGMRVEAEPDAAEEIAQLCGGHPQALRVAATYAAARPNESLRDLASRLSREQDRLALLSPPEDPDSLRARFDRSYHAVRAAGVAWLYRLLSLFPPGEQITAEAAAVVGDQPVDTAREELRELASRHLLEETATQRWTMPHLLQLHATDRARAQGPAEHLAAFDRLLRWYHQQMTRVAVLLAPRSVLPASETSAQPVTVSVTPQAFDPSDRRCAVAWADQEASTIAALIQQARAHDRPGTAWRLAVACAPYFRLRRRWPLWIRGLIHGLHAARDEHDVLGEAWCSHYLGWAHVDLHHYPEAVKHLRHAVELHERLGQPAGVAWSQCALAQAYAGMNRWEHAHSVCAEAMTGFGDIGDEAGTGYAGAWWSATALQLGDLDAAAHGLNRAMTVLTSCGSLDGQALVHTFLAETYRAANQPQRAMQHADHALTLRRALTDTAGEAEALLIRGDLQLDAELYTQARHDWTHALALFSDVSDPQATDAQTRLTTINTDKPAGTPPITTVPAVTDTLFTPPETRPRLPKSAGQRHAIRLHRQELPMSDDQQHAPEIRTDVPHSARIWNYWMGGKDNYAVDRAAGDAAIAIYPGIATMVQQSRQFLIRAVRFLAGEAGIRQFLDIGTGLPTEQNTHEVAQAVAPESKIVYVDNDPLVLAHARALMKSTTGAGTTDYLHADLHNPERVLEHARNTLDFTQPIAVMFMGVLGHVQDYQDSRQIVATVLDAVPSGSYLALYVGATDDDGLVKLSEEYAKTGAEPYKPRSREQIRGYFDGLDMVTPGFVPTTHWRPDTESEIKTISSYCGVARKL